VTINPSSWSSRKWAVLASATVLAAILAACWHLTGGCETKSETPDADRVRASLTVLRAMNDQNVLELSLQVAYFFALRGQLPETIEQVAQTVHGPDWPPTPSVSTLGIPTVYRATGARTYELVLPGEDKRPGTSDDVVIPQEVPEDLPTDADPSAFRTWWILKQLDRLPTLLPEGMKDILPETPPAGRP